ncbi:NRDE protein-domain-containing protein [Blakeslea trispora]|nr:NRDE protein-domain-containing protein [Blakeslea trispora]
MCILFWTVDNHPKYRFIFASNRDEFIKRPTARAHFWEPPHQDILAGTDLEVHQADPSLKNGTWLGITRSGRFSALTNFREQKYAGSLSRGLLVRDFLQAKDTVDDTIQALEKQAQDYNGFNLVCFDFSQQPVTMAYLTNRKNQPKLDLQPKEIYGLSNSILTEPWPKVNQGKIAFEALIHRLDGKDENAFVQALFELLSTTEPITKTDNAQELLNDLQTRIYIPHFDWPKDVGLKQPTYGTRSSNIVLIDYDNHVTFVERLWSNPHQFDDQHYEFDLQ